jgi:hypothetical protein
MFAYGMVLVVGFSVFCPFLWPMQAPLNMPEQYPLDTGTFCGFYFRGLQRPFPPAFGVCAVVQRFAAAFPRVAPVEQYVQDCCDIISLCDAESSGEAGSSDSGWEVVGSEISGDPGFAYLQGADGDLVFSSLSCVWNKPLVLDRLCLSFGPKDHEVAFATFSSKQVDCLLSQLYDKIVNETDESFYWIACEILALRMLLLRNGILASCCPEGESASCPVFYARSVLDAINFVLFEFCLGMFEVMERYGVGFEYKCADAFWVEATASSEKLLCQFFLKWSRILGDLRQQCFYTRRGVGGVRPRDPCANEGVPQVFFTSLSFETKQALGFLQNFCSDFNLFRLPFPLGAFE